LTNVEATQYWTATNIADGLNALAICIEVSYHLSIAMVKSSIDHDFTDGLLLSAHDVGIHSQ
jgi:hypothetical protein